MTRKGGIMINKLSDNFVAFDNNNNIISYSKDKDELFEEIKNYRDTLDRYNVRVYKFYDSVLKDEIMEYFSN